MRKGVNKGLNNDEESDDEGENNEWVGGKNSLRRRNMKSSRKKGNPTRRKMRK